MDFPRNRRAFFFTDALETGCKRAELVERLLKLFLSMPAFRNLYAQLFVDSGEHGCPLFHAQL